MILLPCLASLAGGCYGPLNETADKAANAAETARCLAPEEADRLCDEVLQLVNLERGAADLPPVVVNTALEKVAADYACRMIEYGFFAHEDPLNGRRPGDRAISGKYAYYSIGENLAAGQHTPAEVMEAWMASPSHRAVILDERWKEIGVAVRTGGECSIYWVQEFGDPAAYALSSHQAR